MVKDTGIGIDPSDAELVFDPFVGLAHAEQNEIGGTGIGLALSKLLIEQMKGSVGVSSHLNKGATFWLRLKTGKPISNVEEACEV